MKESSFLNGEQLQEYLEKHLGPYALRPLPIGPFMNCNKTGRAALGMAGDGKYEVCDGMVILRRPVLVLLYAEFMTHPVTARTYPDIVTLDNSENETHFRWRCDFLVNGQAHRIAANRENSSTPRD